VHPSSVYERTASPNEPSVLLAVLRFHLETGVRVALGLGSLGIVGFIAVVGLQPEPAAFLRSAARAVAGGGASSGFRFLLALVGLGSAFAAARRAGLGTRGWELHLPIHPADQRRAFVLALVCAQALVVALWVALWIGGVALGVPARLSTLAAIAWVAVAAGTAATPFAKRWPRVAAWAALGLGAWGNWPALLGATGCLAAVEGWGGGLQVGRRGGARFGRAEATRFSVALLTWRALGWRILSVVVVSFIPLALAWLVLRNNAILSAGEAAVVVRGGCVWGMMWVITGLAGRLVHRRPPWIWSRSLPWSARSRVLHDAAFLSLHVAPVLLGGLLLDPAAAWPVAGAGVYLGVRGAGVLRRHADSASGLGWRWTVENVLVVLAVAAFGWFGAVLAALSPLAFLGAERSEKTLRVSLMRERQYSSVGDPTW
jgi:hypothetical protein